jgi:23S rRNA (adenine2503-C2)-methyltransferase
MPHPKWSFSKLSEYGEAFVKKGDRKIALNFAWTKDMPIDPDVIDKYFSREKFCVKITPLNPTMASEEGKLLSAFDPLCPEEAEKLCDDFMSRGYETILSIGDTRENEIGSNCGMSVRKFRQG